MSSSPVSSDIKLETEGDEKNCDDASPLEPDTYIPRRALRNSLKDWIDLINTHETTSAAILKPANQIPLAVIPPAKPMINFPHTTVNTEPPGIAECILPPTVISEGAVSSIPDNPLISCVNTCATSTPTTNTAVGISDALDALAGVASLKDPIVVDKLGVDPHPPEPPEPPQAVLMNAVNSLACEDKIIRNVIEPMDCNNDEPSAVESTSSGSGAEQGDSDAQKEGSMDSDVEMQTEMEITENGTKISLSDMERVVDLFYLPFEHGTFAVTLLEEFHWLKTNSCIVNNVKARQSESPEVQEWKERAAAFEGKANKISRTFTDLTKIRNRSLVYDFYPYTSDMKGVVSLLLGFIKWLGIHIFNSSSFTTLVHSVVCVRINVHSVKRKHILHI